MPIRALTDDELDQSQTAKQHANERLKNMRSTLRQQRRGLSSKQLGELEHRISEFKAIKDKPVTFVLDGERISLDYAFLTKFTKSLDKQGFWYDFRIHGADFDRTLTIRYRHQHREDCHGQVELFQISARQLDLLQGLPEVELEG